MKAIVSKNTPEIKNFYSKYLADPNTRSGEVLVVGLDNFDFIYKLKLNNIVNVVSNVDYVYNDYRIIDSKNALDFKEYLEKMNKTYTKMIMNPPFNGSLHLDIFNTALDHLDKTHGVLTIVEPATWLINVRKNGKAKEYDKLKKRIQGHVESIIIENFNKEFGTGLFMPFSITKVDMGHVYDTIDCTICGEHKVVDSIYDCNLIGKYDTIWSILNKVLKYDDMMKNHITNKDLGREYWYSKYADLDPLPLCQLEAERVGRSYDHSDTIFKEHCCGVYCSKFSTVAYHYYNNEISNKPLCAYDRGKHLTDKIAENVYGKKEDLENWKHFIFNNKLPLFINIVLTFDQHNNSTGFLPWLVDKKYTDEEINKLFGFTDEEIKFIDDTLVKFEKNSPWFKRYMCGPKA